MIINSEILERVIEAVADPTLLNTFDLSEEGRRIRFNYEGVRYIVYISGHVTITEQGIEKGSSPEASAMKKLLDTPTYNHRYIPRRFRRK
ncbi:hypothetical protein LCGC14_2168470 [marine sediment metagenome]|uniref:Uncharacterized protein n=1 Tax=marine sediment metagenome TaxID=412755 RepID=A0A0F9ECX4_9ZZZZ